MTLIKKLPLVLLIFVALVVTGCGGERHNTQKNPSGHREFDITLNDGRELHCVQLGAGNAESATCDWENAS